jgi:hypothetical protein
LGIAKAPVPIDPRPNPHADTTVLHVPTDPIDIMTAQDAFASVWGEERRTTHNLYDDATARTRVRRDIVSP